MERSIHLDDHSAGFIERIIADGRYASATDVVRAGLDLLEEDERRLETLRSALIEGEESGVIEDFDFDAFLAEQRSAWAG